MRSGLNAFLLTKIGASLATSLMRKEAQNHTLSRFMGPPNDSLKSTA